MVNFNVMLQPNTSNTEILNKAKSYPFRIPESSYLFYNGLDYCLHELNQVEYLADRIPVLASGSNASPEQLARKFAHLEEVLIPVLKVKLLDFDVVYSAHFCSYGSIPATFYYCPGTILNTFITYLTPSQLEQMHRTEGLGFNYCFARLDRVKVILENNVTLNQVQFYLSLHGCLCLNNSPIALAAITAENRQFPQMNQLNLLQVVAEELASDINLDRFILETVGDRSWRRNRIQQLKETAKPFNYHHYHVF